MHVTWVQTRLILILLLLFALPLALVFRVMGRQVREDYRLQRKWRTRNYEKLATNLGYLALVILGFALIMHETVGGFAFAGFALAISLTVWLNRPRSN